MSRAMPTALSWMATPTTWRPSRMCGPSRVTRARAIPTGSWSPRLPNNRRSCRTEGAALALVAALTLTSCARQAPAPAPAPSAEPEQLSLTAADFSDLPGWSEDRQIDALAALRRSCAHIVALADDAALDPTLDQPAFGRVRD